MIGDYARNYSDLSHPSAVSGNGAFAEYILPEEEKDWLGLSIGSTVIIEDKRDGRAIWLSGKVIEIKALSPFMVDRDVMLYHTPDNQATSILDEISGPHSEQQLVAKVEIEFELKRTNGHWSQSPIQKPASNWSRMRIPLIHSKEPDTPSMSDILGLKEKGVEVGFYGPGNEPREENGEFLSYRLDIENLDNKHQFIVGESGSGKTVLLKKLAMEFRKTTIDGEYPRVIMTDVQGDLMQLMMSSFIKSIPRKGWQSRLPNSETTEDSLENMGPFQLILPVSKHQNDKDIAAIKKVIEANGHKVTQVGLRLDDIEHIEELEYLLRLNSEQAVIVLEDEMEAMKIDNRKVTLDRLKGQLERLMYEQSKEKQITTSQGNTYLRSTFAAAKRGLRHLRDIFDVHEDSNRLNNNPLECLKFDGTSVFYLEHLGREEQLMWGMQLVKWLYDNKREDGDFFVFIDEAHMLVPSRPPVDGKSGTFPRLRSNFEKLAREGRKFGINLILGTQSPKDLHEIVPQQCPTKIVMKIDNSNAKAAGIEGSEARIASRFGQGQMFLKSNFNGTADWIRLHSPAPSLPHQPMANFWSNLRVEAKKQVNK